ncbi:hypothetical protein Tco_0576610 [Tanacetum coccineum]
MVALLSSDHVIVPLDHALAPPQQYIVMADAIVETTALEVVASLDRRLRLSSDSPNYWMGMIEYDMETLQARVDVAELRAEILQLALADAREETMELRTRVSTTMSTMGQGMSSVEIEHIIAQRVTNAIEEIAIYETKTREAFDSMYQVARHYKNRFPQLKNQKHCNQKEKNGKACRDTNAVANNVNA